MKGSDNRMNTEFDPEEIDFSMNLFGKDGLETVQQLCLAEFKLLEHMEFYAERRAKIDLEYADKLTKLHGRVKLPETSEYTGSSSIDKAWRAYLTESENKAITVSNMAKTVTQQILPRIKTLYSRKKNIVENLKSVRYQADKAFADSYDEKVRLENIYKDVLKDTAKWRDKIDDSYFNKTRNSKDWHKLKGNLDQASRKLHINHNDYILSITSLNEHQKHCHQNIYPYMLQAIQELLERFVEPWKDILSDLQSNTSWCREEFFTSEKELEQSIKFISSANEYQGFLRKHKKTPDTLESYVFNKNLVSNKNATSGLTDTDLAINDLTHQQLIDRKKTLEEDQVKLEGLCRQKLSQYNEQLKILQEMSSSDNGKTVMSIIDQCLKCHNLQLEVKDNDCKLDMMQLQFELVDAAVKTVESEPLPYIDLNPPNMEPPAATLPPRQNNISSNANARNRNSTLPRIFNRIKSRPSTQQSSSVLSDSDDSDVAYDEPFESLELCSWYHGKINRPMIQRLLRADGDFLVREKSDGCGDIVLSLLWKGVTKHFILKPDENGMYKLEGDAFHNIPALINHHHDKRVVIKATEGIILNNPIKRAFVEGDRYTVAHDDIRLDTKLGGGHFGDVYRGLLISNNTRVAVKTCKPNADESVKEKFLQEAEIMKPCSHKNVVNLIGVCYDREPYYIILELCEKGDLQNVLKREGVRLEMYDLWKMCLDIAQGMAYLENKQIIHRDLAARNCLVTREYSVKVSDFGMSREEDNEGIYSMQNTREIPYKWCAPEIWNHKRYTIKSDVWSYGVTLWEIFSLGGVPYSGWTNKQTTEKIDNGYRMHPPSGTPPQIFVVMQSCWEADENQRPHFRKIVSQLEKMKNLFS